VTCPTSAGGLGSPLPHLHQQLTRHLQGDWADPCHICPGTGLAPLHICTETGLVPSDICTGTALTPATSPLRRQRPQRRFGSSAMRDAAITRRC
jgi:hypothetical protein